MAYTRVEPWGEEREDWRAAMVASTIANVNRGKSQKPFKPEDFMPDVGGKRKKSADELLEVVEGLNAAFGGKDKRGH